MKNTKMIHPDFTAKEAVQLAEKFFGIKGAAKPLSSYIDQNFLITAVDKKKYVLKIFNSLENPVFIQNQSAATSVLKKKTGYLFPGFVSSVNNESIEKVEKNGVTFVSCLLNFVDGKFISEVKNPSVNLAAQTGSFLGKMDKVLENLNLPSQNYELRWNPDNFRKIYDLAQSIANEKDKNTVLYFLNLYRDEVVPQMHKLRRQLIHNDANDSNFLIDEKTNKITGLIDFGDMSHTFRINELAVALAYMMMGRENPVENVLPVIRAYNGVNKLEEIELGFLYHFIVLRLCTSVSISAADKMKNPLNAHITVSEKSAWELLRKFIVIDPFYAKNKFRSACGLKPLTPDGKPISELLSARHEHLGKALSLSYNKPLKITRGLFQYLFDEKGNPYLDTVNNVCHVGHCHPVVVESAKSQIAMLNTNTRYLHDNIVEYAEKLTATLPGKLKVCYFVCSGSEANELALRMAKAHTGSDDFIVIDHAYHGNTNSVINISPYKFNGPGGKGCPVNTHIVPIPDLYRGIFREDDPFAPKKYACEVNKILDGLKKMNRKPAAFIAESVSGVAGQIVWPEGYLQDVYKMVRKAGAVCIADEVQTGFGRIGTHMWAFQAQGVIPDIVVMGKPIGNGHPLAAVVTTAEIARSFENGMEYFNTFGGNPVSCAIGNAVLDVIKKEKLMENAHETGMFFKSELVKLQKKYELIGIVRGEGLFLGFEMVQDRISRIPAVKETSLIAEGMKKHGILASVDGPFHNIIKIKPPICFNRENVKYYINSLKNILDVIS